MLRVRSTQLSAILERAASEFVDELHVQLRAERPELLRDLSESEARGAIAQGVELARRYGFSVKSVVGRFVILRLERGAQFDSTDEVRRLLLDATAGERRRIEQTERFFNDRAARA